MYSYVNPYGFNNQNRRKNDRDAKYDKYGDREQMEAEIEKEAILLCKAKKLERIVGFTGYFDFNNILHSHNTRSSKNIHMYRANSTFGQRSFKYKAANLWNELPLEVKEQRYSSVGRLKLILTSYLLNQTTTVEAH